MSADKVTHGLKVAGSMIGCASMTGGIAFALLVGTAIGIGIVCLFGSGERKSSKA